MPILCYIAGNELRRIFKSPLAWTIMAVVQFLTAVFFYVLLQQYLSPGTWQAHKGVTETVVAGVLQISGIILLLVSPLLTMRLISEERRSGTIKLLMSSPITLTQLVLGKYLAIILFYLCLIGIISLMPLSLLFGTPLDMGQLFAGLAGLTLLVSSFAAIGLFISSLCRSPAVAATATFGALFIMWIINLAGLNASEKMAGVFSYLSLLRHYNSLLDGIFNSVDVLYYLILSSCCIILTIWRLDAERLHG